MSQQTQPPTQGGQTFTQTPTTQQQPQQGASQGMQGGQTMNETLPDAYWTGLTSVAQAIAVCEFCASQCIHEADPMMLDCIKLCEDVADIGKTVLSVVPTESYNAEPIVEAFQQAVQACAQECGQHQHAHCQECAQVLGQTLETIPQLQSGGQGMGQSTQSMGTQPMGTQTNQF